MSMDIQRSRRMFVKTTSQRATKSLCPHEIDPPSWLLHCSGIGAFTKQVASCLVFSFAGSSWYGRNLFKWLEPAKIKPALLLRKMPQVSGCKLEQALRMNSAPNIIPCLVNTSPLKSLKHFHIPIP